jgi:hypothetical protein
MEASFSHALFIPRWQILMGVNRKLSSDRSIDVLHTGNSVIIIIVVVPGARCCCCCVLVDLLIELLICGLLTLAFGRSGAILIRPRHHTVL